MRNGFAARLAANNIKNNHKFYIPYILASSGIIAIFYIMMYVATNKGLGKLSGTQYISLMLALGCGIVAIFSLIFLFYINSFLMKRRSREIGLYNILGMEKKHIGRILLLENCMTTVISLVVGLLCGILFSKLVFMIYCKAVGVGTPISDVISIRGAATTVVLFAVFFLLILLRNQMAVKLSKPIELLQGGSKGEKEPKVKKVLTVVGIICMLGGYVIANMISNPLEAILLFFAAVVLVIIGTYLLFTTASVAILKGLKKRKKYYYRPNHFTSVSGMLYRMKQNAVGMANICILATMVLVIVSTTVCLQRGISDTIDAVTPDNICVRSQTSEKADYNRLEISSLDSDISTIKDLSAKENIGISKVRNYSTAQFRVKIDGNKFTARNGSAGMNLGFVAFITQDQYERFTGEKVSISGDKVISVGDNKASGKVQIGGKEYDCADHLQTVLPNNMVATDYRMFIVKDVAAVKTVSKALINDGAEIEIDYSVFLDADASGNQTIALSKDIAKALSRDGEYLVPSTRIGVSEMLYGFTSGFLFLGVLLGLTFTFAAALIIYYKQISEGYYDKDQYVIMQKVGMSKDEVRKSIRSQVMAVFFAPLAVAGCHMAGASNMMYQLLQMFDLDNIGLFVYCSLITFGIFAVIYAAVYAVTAKEYYKIVKWGE
ncbi:MAG: ABC transporter permease [Eubacteriaceae bacterium]|nr:ABC transporter permease [Eubacteriaceae bacterium]